MATVDLNKLLPMPRGPKLSPEERQRLDVESEQRERTRPCYGQTHETIKPWLKKHAAPGLIVVVRSMMGAGVGEYEYVLEEVTKIHTRSFNTRSTHAWNAAAYGARPVLLQRGFGRHADRTGEPSGADSCRRPCGD